jgi:chitin disaccharide deacetylase
MTRLRIVGMTQSRPCGFRPSSETPDQGRRLESRESNNSTGPTAVGSACEDMVVPRTVLINVDDIGIYRQAVEPAIATITDGAAASGSVMMVCSGTSLALDLLAARPEIPVGVHLTLCRDVPSWEWPPLTAGSSIQHDGLLLPLEQRDQLLAQAQIAHVVDEFRAQIEKALEAGLRLTHLDWHCLADGGRQDIFDATLALADEYGTALRAWTGHGRHRLRAMGLVAQDHPFLDSFALPLDAKVEELLERVRQLPPGLSEWAMHPAAPNLDDPGSGVRSSDRAALLSPALIQALAHEDIVVVGYERPHRSGLRCDL